MDHTIFPIIDTDDEQWVKLSHDRYEVYVNGDFVGTKTLLIPNEEIEELNHFLYEHGFHAFEANCDGDHYDIDTMVNVSEMRDVLQMYLQMR
jgi:hypothetical protein